MVKSKNKEKSHKKKHSSTGSHSHKSNDKTPVVHEEDVKHTSSSDEGEFDSDLEYLEVDYEERDNIIEVERQVVVENAFLFDRKTLRTHVHNTLVSKYQHKAYHKSFFASFNAKVINYVNVLMELFKPTPETTPCEFTHPLLNKTLLPIISARVNISRTVGETGGGKNERHIADVWNDENSNLTSYETMLSSWQEMSSYRYPSLPANVVAKVYQLFIPFETATDGSKTPLTCLPGVDTLNLISRGTTGTPIYSYTKVLGPHTTTIYAGDKVDLIGLLIHHDVSQLARRNIPTLDLNVYLKLIENLQKGDKVDVYFHEGNGQVLSALYKVSKVNQGETIELKPKEGNRDQVLVYDLKTLQGNTCMIWPVNRPEEVIVLHKMEWMDKNAAILFDAKSTIPLTDQIAFCVTTPSQRMFWLAQQKKLKFYSLDMLVKTYPELAFAKGQDFQTLKSRIDKCVRRLPHVSKTKFKNIKTFKNKYSPIRILNIPSKIFKWSKTFIDTPLARMHCLLTQTSDHGILPLYMSVLKDVEDQIAHINTHKFINPSTPDTPIKQTLQLKYPSARVFKSMEEALEASNLPTTKHMKAIVPVNGIDILVKSKKSADGQWNWDIDRSALPVWTALAQETLKEIAIHSGLKSTYYKKEDVPKHLELAAKNLQKEVKRWKTLNKKRHGYAYTPREMSKAFLDLRTFKGDEDDEEAMIVDDEGFGIFKTELKQRIEEKEEEIRDNMKKSEVDRMKGRVREFASESICNIRLKPKEISIIAHHCLTIRPDTVTATEAYEMMKQTIDKRIAAANLTGQAAEAKRMEMEIGLEKKFQQLLQVENARTANIQQDRVLAIFAFFAAFMMLYKPKRIMNMTVTSCLSPLGHIITRENLLYYLSCILFNYVRQKSTGDPKTQDDTVIGMRSWTHEQMLDEMTKAYNQLSKTCKQFDALVAKRQKFIDQSLVSEIGSAGSVWTTFRPAQLTSNSLRDDSTAKSKNPHIIASNYVMHIQREFASKPRVKESLSPACCLTLHENAIEFWKNMLDAYPSKKFLGLLNKQQNKNIRRRRYDVQRYPLELSADQAFILRKDIKLYSAKPDQEKTLHALDIHVDDSTAMKMRDFMKSNWLFTRDKNLQDVVDNLEDASLWNKFTATLQRMFDDVRAVLVKLGAADMQKIWTQIEQDTHHVTDLDRFLVIRDTLYGFYQNDFVKVMARSIHHYRVALIRKPFIPSKDRKAYEEQLSRESEVTTLHGQNIVPIMSKLIPDATNDTFALKWNCHVDPNHLRNNVYVLCYVFVKSMLCLIQGIHDDNNMSSLERWNWEQDYRVNGSLHNKDILQSVLNTIFDLYRYRHDRLSNTIRDIVNIYESQREEKKQAQLKKMNDLLKEDRDLMNELKKNNLAQYADPFGMGDWYDIGVRETDDQAILIDPDVDDAVPIVAAPVDDDHALVNEHERNMDIEGYDHVDVDYDPADED